MKFVATAISVAVSALVLSAGAASAAIVCNNDGDCWHAKRHYDYKPGLHLHVYPNNWKWRESDASHYRWREHHGRGYWRGGVWVDL